MSAYANELMQRIATELAESNQIRYQQLEAQKESLELQRKSLDIQELSVQIHHLEEELKDLAQ